MLGVEQISCGFLERFPKYLAIPWMFEALQCLIWHTDATFTLALVLPETLKVLQFRLTWSLIGTYLEMKAQYLVHRQYGC